MGIRRFSDVNEDQVRRGPITLDRVRCQFCAFYVETQQDEKIKRFLGGLDREIHLYGQEVGLETVPVTSVYFGGGTPTVLRILMPKLHVINLLGQVSGLRFTQRLQQRVLIIRYNETIGLSEAW